VCIAVYNYTTYRNNANAIRTITTTKRTAPKMEPITIAAISPPERSSSSSDCAGVSVTVGVIIIVVLVDIVEDGVMAKAMQKL